MSSRYLAHPIAHLTAESCDDGACACPNGKTLCGLVCVNLKKDPKNCGDCGEKCAPMTMCQMGACK